MAKNILILALLMTALFAACTPTQQQSPMTVFLVVDGRSLTYAQNEPITVGEFLQAVDVELGELDAVNPPDYTQLADNMRVTVVRVQEETYCEDRDLPYQTVSVPNEAIPPGEERLSQTGVNGKERVCYRVITRDGVRGEPVQSGQPTTIQEPVDEIIFVGPLNDLDPVDTIGTLAYISNGNAWIIRINSEERRPLTNTGDLDHLRVFSLSPDGQQLLFARTSNEEDEFNQLWLISDTSQSAPEPVRLRPSNVLYADWVPNRPNTISYSRAESSITSPGWRAYNDLWLMLIDPQTGTEIRVDPIIEEASGSGGPYGWWGRQYVWSPDGESLMWIHADAIGTVDLETGALNTAIHSFPVFTSRSDWSWRTTASWSPDGRLVATTVHGPPINNESPERSPVFNVGLVSADGSFAADLVEQAGIWSYPKFSPFVEDENRTFPVGYLSWMQARRPLDSISDSAEYDLYVADRDGSNARRLFPAEGQPGIRSRDYTWSPDGKTIALIYQGNLWIVDVRSGTPRQLTADGRASHPIWSR